MSPARCTDRDLARLRLASLRDGSRDGRLMIVDPSGTRCAPAAPAADTLQQLLDRWEDLAPALAQRCETLQAQAWAGCAAFDARHCMAPLPRAYQWADASVYRNHARLVYQWRGEPIPAGYEREPLVYQGGSDAMLGPCEPLTGFEDGWDVDFEAEIGVITGDVPMGASAEEAAWQIRLVVLLNDISLRGLIPEEARKGFGFFQGKPSTAARTRRLAAGTIVGAGTVSNADPATGSACITEARVRAQLAGAPEHALPAYLRVGDRVRIEVTDDRGHSIFGAIEQQRR